jgi:hypothetical protein
MTPAERNNSLTNRTPEARARIMAKVHEYQVLPPDERELRLRSTDLRWYLTTLFPLPPDNRQERLAQVPEELRGLVNSRLTQWDALPPELQREFLANEHTMRYFSHLESSNAPAATPEQQKIAEQFNQLFELSDAEKQQALATLSDAERAQMQKTLKSFEDLPAKQRALCVRNYAKFAGMNPAERSEFLKNAEHWSQMSPAERQAWRDLVAHVPMWPPTPLPVIPKNLYPPTVPPHKTLKDAPASMATN